MKTPIALCLFILTGCQSFSPPEAPDQTIVHHALPDRSAVYAELDRLGISDRKRAFATWGGGEPCNVYYVHDDQYAMFHEVQHCYHGHYHKGSSIK